MLNIPIFTLKFCLFIIYIFAFAYEIHKIQENEHKCGTPALSFYINSTDNIISNKC